MLPRVRRSEGAQAGRLSRASRARRSRRVLDLRGLSGDPGEPIGRAIGDLKSGALSSWATGALVGLGSVLPDSVLGVGPCWGSAGRFAVASVPARPSLSRGSLRGAGRVGRNVWGPGVGAPRTLRRAGVGELLGGLRQARSAVHGRRSWSGPGPGPSPSRVLGTGAGARGSGGSSRATHWTTLPRPSRQLRVPGSAHRLDDGEAGTMSGRQA